MKGCQCQFEGENRKLLADVECNLWCQVNSPKPNCSNRLHDHNLTAKEQESKQTQWFPTSKDKV